MGAVRILRSQLKCPMWAHGPAALLAIVFLMAVGIACTGTGGAPQSETALATETPKSNSTVALIDGATWILRSIGGQPTITGTHLTLTMNGRQFGGFDGCNSFGGQHESGTSVVKPDGTISVPAFAVTAAGCPTDAILDQANRYLGVMTQRASARIVDGRLHIIDSSGDVALVFARQTPLAGQPIDLAGTGWRLEDRYGTYGEEPTTVVFLDDRAAVGTTACRDYALGYAANAGRIRIFYTGMSGSAEGCSRDAVNREHFFTEDFGWANEYSTPYTQGALRSLRMVVRTSRGKTLTFAPLSQPPDAIFDRPWTFVRSLESRSEQSGMRWVEDTDSAPGSYITARFDENTVAGSLGCHSYAYLAAGGEGSPLVGWADGSMSMSQATLSTKQTCDGEARISPHQRRFLDLLAISERYHVLDDRLVIRTRTGDALVFGPADSPPPTPEAPAGKAYIGEWEQVDNRGEPVPVRRSRLQIGRGRGDGLGRPLNDPLADSAALFDLPTDEATLLRDYTLSDDIEQIRVRRGDATDRASVSSSARFDVRAAFWGRGKPFHGGHRGPVPIRYPHQGV